MTRALQCEHQLTVAETPGGPRSVAAVSARGCVYAGRKVAPQLPQNTVLRRRCLGCYTGGTMGKWEDVLDAVKCGDRDAGIRFSDLTGLAKTWVRASHTRQSPSLSAHRLRAREPATRRRHGQALPSQASATCAGGRKRVMDYEILIYHEDGIWVAEAPELPGCAVHGASKAEALSKIESLIPEWIASARESGIPIPAPSGRVAVLA